MNAFYFWVQVTFVLLIVTVIITLKTIYFTKTCNQKYYWALSCLVAASSCMSELLYIQSFLAVISPIKSFAFLIICCEFAPYLLWLIAIYYLHRAAEAKKAADFRQTHYQSLYALDFILLAVLLPLLNVFFTLWQLRQSTELPMIFI